MPLSRTQTRTPRPAAPPHAQSRVTRSGQRVGSAIRSYREDGSEPIPFGVWGDVVEPGTVRLGDPVEPLA